MCHYHFLSQLTHYISSFFFFFNDTATTEIYTLSLHDALPISRLLRAPDRRSGWPLRRGDPGRSGQDRKSTRLNSSHTVISYAVFCLKKKKITRMNSMTQVSSNYDFIFHSTKNIYADMMPATSC